VGLEKLVIGVSKDVQRGSFVVAECKNDKKFLDPEDMNQIFTSDGSMASMLFGWGIARHSAEKIKTMIIFHPEEVVTFPEVEDEGE
jgi:hypothetical protein